MAPEIKQKQDEHNIFMLYIECSVVNNRLNKQARSGSADASKSGCARVCVHMCVYVCVYVCMCVWMCVCVCGCVPVVCM